MERVIECLKRTNERELTQPCPDKEMVFDGQKVRLSQVKRYIRRKNISVTSHGDTKNECLERVASRSDSELRSDLFNNQYDDCTARGFTPFDLSLPGSFDGE